MLQHLDSLTEEEEIRLMQHLKEHLGPAEGCPICGHHEFSSGQFGRGDGSENAGVGDSETSLIGVRCRNCSHYMFFGPDVIR